MVGASREDLVSMPEMAVGFERRSLVVGESDIYARTGVDEIAHYNEIAMSEGKAAGNSRRGRTSAESSHLVGCAAHLVA
jgi:hypothetical protein